MKLLFTILLMLSITGCGVNSSSGANLAPAANDSNDDTNNPTGGDEDNVTDPGDDNTTDPGDNNTTDPGDDTTDPGDDTVDPADSIFDTTGDVIYDSNACNANFYRTAADASYNGDSSSENGSSFFNVENEGLLIRSEHLESDPSKLGKTWVTLFYKTFPTKDDLGLQGTTSYLMDGFFHLSYDIAWTDGSIPNVDNTLYVQSAQTEKPSCHRLVLDSVTGQDIDVQKVYR